MAWIAGVRKRKEFKNGFQTFSFRDCLDDKLANTVKEVGCGGSGIEVKLVELKMCVKHTKMEVSE